MTTKLTKKLTEFLLADLQSLQSADPLQKLIATRLLKKLPSFMERKN
jgi:hypothetical protein